MNELQGLKSQLHSDVASFMDSDPERTRMLIATLLGVMAGERPVEAVMIYNTIERLATAPVAELSSFYSYTHAW